MINSIEHLLLGVPPLLVYLGVTLVVGVESTTYAVYYLGRAAET